MQEVGDAVNRIFSDETVRDIYNTVQGVRDRVEVMGAAFEGVALASASGETAALRERLTRIVQGLGEMTAEIEALPADKDRLLAQWGLGTAQGTAKGSDVSAHDELYLTMARRMHTGLSNVPDTESAGLPLLAEDFIPTPASLKRLQASVVPFAEGLEPGLGERLRNAGAGTALDMLMFGRQGLLRARGLTAWRVGRLLGAWPAHFPDLPPVPESADPVLASRLFESLDKVPARYIDVRVASFRSVQDIIDTPRLERGGETRGAVYLEIHERALAFARKFQQARRQRRP